MSYLVLARKWRPQVFEDLIGQEHISLTLKNAIIHGKVAHAYIFSGPRGVGKTTTARILAKALNCARGTTPEFCGKCPLCRAISDGSSMDVSEIDGASNTGVDNIRDLREKVRYAPSGGRYKVYIIDEAHMLSTSAFNALLKTLEEPPLHTVFVLATTEPKKIPPTVLSRCQHLPFRRISSQRIGERLKFISKAEDIKATVSAIEMIARVSDGSMRDSLTILEQASSFSEDIMASDIKDLLGITNIETLSKLTSAVIEGDRIGIINIISGLVNSGIDLKILTKDLLQFNRNLIIAKIAGDARDIIELSEEELSTVNRLRDKTTEEHMALILSELIKAESGVRSALYPRIALEMTLIRLSLLSHFRSINDALKVVQHAGLEVQKASEIERTGRTREDKKVENGGSSSPYLVNSSTSRHLNSLPVADIWNATLEKIREINHPLSCKLRDCDIAFGDNELKITFNGGLSVHAESARENLPIIKEAFQHLSGKDVAIKVEIAKAEHLSKKDLRAKALKDPIVRETLEVLEGRIVDVMPINNR